MDGQWQNPIYRETVTIVLAFLFIVSLFLFFFRKRNAHWVKAWASIKSWLIGGPIILFISGMEETWMLGSLTIVALAGAKAFFRLTGMYHRTYFVWACYLGIISLPFLIYYQMSNFYDVTPMLVLAGICMIPIIRDSAKLMVQYVALTLMCFSFMGWAFMHLGWLIYLDQGPFLIIYIILLTEICENIHLVVSKQFGKTKLFAGINSRRTLEGVVVSLVFTLLLAWAMRHLMPIREERFWLASGVVAVFAGGLGDLVLSGIRKDLGIKQVGAFIIGRGDFLRRVERLIFVAPIYYYVMQFLLATT